MFTSSFPPFPNVLTLQTQVDDHTYQSRPSLFCNVANLRDKTHTTPAYVLQAGRLQESCSMNGGGDRVPRQPSYSSRGIA